MELEGYSGPTYNKLVHAAMTRWAVVGAIHKLNVDRITRRPAKGGHVLLFEVLSSVRQALALYGKMSGFSQSLTCPHCWLRWHDIISIVYTDLISIYCLIS